jgi:hypothetical protein
MVRTRAKISIVRLLAPLAFTSAWPVVAQNSANEFWPQAKVFVNFSPAHEQASFLNLPKARSRRISTISLDL